MSEPHYLLEFAAQDVQPPTPAIVRLRRWLKNCLIYGFRLVSGRETEPLPTTPTIATAEDAVRRLLNGTVYWSGEQANLIFEPRRGERFLVQAGDGDHEHAFEQARRLKAALESACLAALKKFPQQSSNAA
jgi:hypothetical protein